MRLVGAVIILLTSSYANAKDDDNSNTPLLRGGSTPHQQLAANKAELLFPLDSSDPLSNFARTGLDRSLAYIHYDTELNLPSENEGRTEILSAMNDYINLYSVDGNDDNSNVCMFDYEGDIDPYAPPLPSSTHPIDKDTRRALQDDTHTVADHGGHSEHDYIESSCNAMLNETTCINWSEYFGTAASSETTIQRKRRELQEGTLEPLPNDTEYLLTEVKVPCGVCVILDASPSQELYGATLDLAEGINIVGKLVIPQDSDIVINTKYIYVQGVLSMPEPPLGYSSSIPSSTEGDKVLITLYGKDDLMFVPDIETDNAHHGPKGVNNKAIVIAGGRLDIHAMDTSCPSWVKLQSIQYGTPLPNVALNKPAVESTTYNNAGAGAAAAVDGNDNSFTHTKCWTGINQWWQVDLLDEFTVTSMEIVNRLDCCGGRLHDFFIRFYDGNMTEVDSIFNAGGIGNRKSYGVDQVNARYVKITLGDQDCLQLGEVKIYGYPSSSSFPQESLDKLTLGDDAAQCWSTKGSRIMLTSDTYEWNDSHTATVESSPSPGVLAVHPLVKKKTAVDETFGFADFAVEVALLDRSFVIQGEKETGDHEKIGGHLIVLHTPMVAQHLEGVAFRNFGQQTRLGRYPLHFHMSECVHGSMLSKNVITESNQRCVVIHGTHNVTISEMVTYDTKGHCFMLEDGGEWDNKFLYNLAAKTRSVEAKIRPEETDTAPSSFWITNPPNHFIGNVAAGSQSTGFWFELKLRAPSNALEINQGSNPKTNPLGSFDDNVAHSNAGRAGITTYETGYRAPPGTTWNNIRSYKNKNSGLFQHGTNNIYLKGGILADNGQAARNFHHEWAVYDDVDVIGRSEHAQSLMDEGRLSEGCGRAGGISIQPNEGMGHGTTIKNTRFSGFDVGCTGGVNSGVYVENDQVRNAVFDAAPTFSNNTFGSLDRRISACKSLNSSPDGNVRLIAIEDSDGTLSGSVAGFYIQDDPAITNFIDTTSCQDTEDCLRFCPGECLRLGIVSVSQALVTRGFNMLITDGDKSGSVARGPIWFDEKQNHLSAQIPIVLPAPTSDKYQLTFTDKNGNPAWPGYANLSLEKAPTCTGALVDKSQVEFVMPSSDDIRCDNLFGDDNYPEGIHGWQNFFAGINVSQDETGSWVINTIRRKSDRGHVNLSRTFDASCFPGNEGRKYHLFGKIRITDAEGNYVATDGTSNASPKLSFQLAGVWSTSWHIPTSSDGTWTDFSQEIILPEDLSSVWKAQIIIDKAEKREFEVKDFGMTLVPSEAPTSSPTHSPSSSPTPLPTASPTMSPSNSPTAPTLSPTGTPSLSPITAAPVSSSPTNLALNGLASAATECHNKFARNVIDGNANSIFHSCNTQGSWVMVDLGKDTLSHIDTVVIKNRADCCGGRLKLFHVEALDPQKTVLWSKYHAGSVGNGVVKTFSVNDGAGVEGVRWVRLRFDDSHKDYLHIGELEAWGYQTSLPPNPPEIYEMALNRPATQSTTYGSGDQASKGNDGNFVNSFHTKCGAWPWWEVDLGVDSFVQDVWITNRVNCCGGRLRDASVDLLDSDRNLVESRLIKGSVGNGKKPQKVFNEETSVGRYIRISMSRNDCLHLSEVEVFGYHTMGMPSASPTPSLVNLSLNKPAAESTTYNNAGVGAAAAVDGNDNSITHTKCWTGINQWWEVDLGTVDQTIVSIEIVNRLDCCGGRLHDFIISFHDEAKAQIDSIFNAGGIGSRRTFPVDFVTGARYIKVTLGDQDCLSLGEVKVMGWYN